MNTRFLALAGVVALTLSACSDGVPAPTARQQQAVKAAQAANTLSFDENAEIENIQRRLELTSQPGLLGFIILLNEAGQPIVYEGVRGKVTSGSKRLTATEQVRCVPVVRDNGESSTCQYETVAAPSDEGTYGSSNPYIYYWTVNGEYRQWSGTYLYSDKPFRLSVEPLVIAVVPELSP